jgi:predicted MFS family arabinose efflux permease
LPLWSFIIIGIGCFSCIAGGYLSNKIGSAKVAFVSLLISGLCCLCSYLFIEASTIISLVFMILWGITVISDSPQFSALVAQTAIPEIKGTALTFVTSIGFAITIGSIQLLNWMFNHVDLKYRIFIILCIGPLFGLLALYRLVRK